MEYCYECQGFVPSNKIQPYKCRICGGKKCENHGQYPLSCNYCNKSYLCSDCFAFDKCCFDFVNGQWVYKSHVSA